MRRRAFLKLALLAGCAPALAARERFARGLLWRVTAKGASPSYVYGTIQLADPRLAALPPRVRSAFERSRTLMLEFVADPYGRERFMQAAMFPDEQTLEQKLGAEDFERALGGLAPLGLSREFVNKMKPWSVLLNLQHAQRTPGAALDTQLAELARTRRMPVAQIEALDEQLFTFEEFPMDSQVALLRHSLGHAAELAELASRTLEAYLAEDLREIWRLREGFSARHPDVAPHQAVMTKRVVHDRSVVMAFRMQRELRRGQAFVALGALHLYGEKGVLALLEADGYRATRVT